MHNFKNDYDVGAHPNILKKLNDTNLESQLGYGADDYTIAAKKLIKEKINNTNAEVFLLSGGTQTNLITISFLLKPYEAVICANSGHIFVNEAGAIEATGHKVISTNSKNGKLNAKHIEKVLEEYDFKPHVAKPRLVYISNSTEIGTIYTKKELSELYSFCQSKDLLLYLDGARLGHALMATNNDLTLPEIAEFTDAFYIGGTKNGALLGEALIFKCPKLAKDFEYVLKQKGALLAKGRILAIQFLELFTNNLYFDLAEHANKMAMKIADSFKENNYDFLTNSKTNQIFPIVPNHMIDKLNKEYLFYVWEKVSKTHSAIRIITSWATKENEVDHFINAINNIEAPVS